jgi:cytidyltransferase-like protein
VTVQKIWELDKLARLLSTRDSLHPERVVLCHGVFDVLHMVHLRHFAWAKSLGTCLVVSVSPDHAVQKGPGRPYFAQDHRAEQVESIQCVDYVVKAKEADAVEIIRKLMPHIYAKGIDVKAAPTPGLVLEMAAVDAYGGETMFGPDTPECHSTDILRHYESKE